MPWFHLSHVLAADTGQFTTPSWPLWMFSFENYVDQSLDRCQKSIGMRLGMRFFIYGMNGSEILLQMHTLIHGLTSHAKTIGIWPGMWPLYLQIGGCNACYRGILLVLVAWVVHDILGNPNFMRIAGMQIWDHGKKWMTSSGTHIYLHLSIFAACKWQLWTYCAFCACALKRARHWRAGLTWPDLTWPGKPLMQPEDGVDACSLIP